MSLCALGRLPLDTFGVKDGMTPEKIRGEAFAPPLSCSGCELGLLLRIEFHSIAGMNIFYGENDHTGGGGSRCAQDDDLANSAAREILNVDLRLCCESACWARLLEDFSAYLR